MKNIIKKSQLAASTLLFAILIPLSTLASAGPCNQLSGEWNGTLTIAHWYSTCTFNLRMRFNAFSDDNNHDFHLETTLTEQPGNPCDSRVISRGVEPYMHVQDHATCDNGMIKKFSDPDQNLQMSGSNIFYSDDQYLLRAEKTG